MIVQQFKICNDTVTKNHKLLIKGKDFSENKELKKIFTDYEVAGLHLHMILPVIQ